ncbi:hypothetical protein BZJ17_10115, partial [Salinivibrio sp. IB574]|uniref:hypothetical protein n=1 Tax=Salinivibrio sp. IB574 TaxID=1909444 RepID=UPI0009892BAF
LVSIDKIFALFDYLESLSPNEEVELVIGGHSRGAAIGLVSFLASLCQASKTEINDKVNIYWEKINKIRLLPADPVAGKALNYEWLNEKIKEFFTNFLGLKNDNFGVETMDSDEPITSLILEIEKNLFKGRKVFEIFIFSARFDARDQFPADENWKRFIDKIISNDGPLADRTLMISAGFRHSSMINKNDEISYLYENSGVSPISLLMGIVNLKCNEWITEKSAIIRDVELEWMKRLKEGDPRTLVLKEKTCFNSYGIESTIMSGDSLYDILSKMENSRFQDPPFLAIEKNGRYMFR